MALPALIKDEEDDGTTPLPVDDSDVPQLEVEHEVELTITAVEEAKVRWQTAGGGAGHQVPGPQVDQNVLQLQQPLYGWGAPLALEWLTLQGSWLVVHYWDVLMVLSLVNLAGVLCMALRLYHLERARDMQAAVQEVEQFLVDARDVYQGRQGGDLEAPLLASEHRLG